MQPLHRLIDKARETCGSDSELARRIGVKPQDLYAIKTGRRPLSPEMVALLADVCELPGNETLHLVAQSIIENPKNAEKAHILRRAFFASLVTFAVVSQGIICDDATASTTSGASNNTYSVDSFYIVIRLWSGVRRLLSRAIDALLNPIRAPWAHHATALRSYGHCWS